MATWAIRPFAPVRRNDGYTFVNYPLHADVTTTPFLAGAVVVLTAGGLVDEAAAGPVAANTVLGVALAGSADYAWKDDTFGTVNPSVPVATADQEFRGTLEGTFAAADVGDEFGVVIDATGYWTILKSETVNVTARVVGVDDDVAVGDVNAPVRFVFVPLVRQLVS